MRGATLIFVASIFSATVIAACDDKWSPPSYASRTAFQEESIEVGPLTLPGTFTKPTTSGPWSALVLVQGSGPSDRDETEGPNKPFRDLAWGLAAHGVAVARYDKRTFTRKSSVTDAFTVDDEYVTDACAAVALLEKRSDVDPKRVYVLGHSQGGTVLARIAKQCPSVAGLIGFAAPTEAFDHTMIRQAKYFGSLPQGQSSGAKKQLASMQETAEKLGDPELATKYANQWIMGAPTKWWVSVMAVHPADEAKAVPQPFLVLQGQRDYQVLASDTDVWRAALEASGRLTIHIYPKLNHLFMEGDGPGLSVPADYGKPNQHVASYVIDDIVNWIDAPKSGADARPDATTK